MIKRMLLSVLIVFLAAACTAKHGFSVVTATGTTIGLSIGKDATGTGVETVLGYKRAEFAYVPTNRDAKEDAGDTGNGAKDSANVLMELHYGGTGTSTIYQRLAVGDIAVTQGGATALFLRDNTGKLDAEAADALATIENIDNDWPDRE